MAMAKALLSIAFAQQLQLAPARQQILPGMYEAGDFVESKITTSPRPFGHGTQPCFWCTGAGRCYPKDLRESLRSGTAQQGRSSAFTRETAGQTSRSRPHEPQTFRATDVRVDVGGAVVATVVAVMLVASLPSLLRHCGAWLRLQWTAWRRAAEADYCCSICEDLLFAPVTMSCGHTTCRHCLNRWLLRSTAPGARFACPVGGACPNVPAQMPCVNRVLSCIVGLRFPREMQRRLGEQPALDREFEAERSTVGLICEVDDAYASRRPLNGSLIARLLDLGADAAAKSHTHTEDSLVTVILNCHHLELQEVQQCASLLFQHGAPLGELELGPFVRRWCQGSRKERRRWQAMAHAAGSEHFDAAVASQALIGDFRVGDAVRSRVAHLTVREGDVGYVTGPATVQANSCLLVIFPGGASVNMTTAEIALDEATAQNRHGESKAEFERRFATHRSIQEDM